MTINLLSEAFAFCVGAYTFTKLDLFSKLIAIQVFVAFLIELVGLQIRAQNSSNVWIYNCFMLVEFSILFIASSITLGKISFISLLILSLYWICWGVEIYINAIGNFAIRTYVIGAITLLISFSIVLYKSVQNRDSLLFQSRFWFSIGIILFFGCNIPFFSMHSYIRNTSNIAQVKMLINLMSFFAHIRYICMAIGFVIVFREVNKQIAYGE